MNLGPREIVILLIVVLVLFGAKRLPDSARSLGRSMRIFKSEMKEMKPLTRVTQACFKFCDRCSCCLWCGLVFLQSHHRNLSEPGL